MANKQIKQRKKAVLWVICLVLLIAVGGVTFFVLNTYFKDGKPIEEAAEATETTEEEKIAPVEDEEIEIEEDETNGGKRVKQYEGEDPNKLGELTGVVTYAGVAGENLMVRTSIDQFLDSGSCELIISRDGQNIYSETVNIVADASTSICQGFDVPAGQIGNGAAQIIINLSSEDKTGTLTTEVNI